MYNLQIPGRDSTISYNAVMFDTLQCAKKLEAAGFTPMQAEAQAETMKDIIDDNLATKLDIRLLETHIVQVEANLRRDIKAVDERITQVEAGLKRDIKAVDERITQVEAGLKRDIAHIETSLKRDIKAVDERITQVEANLKRDISQVETSLKRDISEMGYKMTIILGSITVAGVAVLSFLMRFPH